MNVEFNFLVKCIGNGSTSTDEILINIPITVMPTALLPCRVHLG